MEIAPKETFYKGYRFRSRLEARWAVFFDALGIEWEYEPEGFTLPNGKIYLPDFRVKCWGTRGEIWDEPFDLYIEVKGVMTEEDAQKIKDFCGKTVLDNFQCTNVPGLYWCDDCKNTKCTYSELTSQIYGPEMFKYPVLIVGNIPAGLDFFPRDVADSSIFKSYKPMNGVDIYPFNYETIDGDHFAAYPAVTSDGKFYLFGDDCNYIDTSACPRILKAYIKAKQARFEHGENG